MEFLYQPPPFFPEIILHAPTPLPLHTPLYTDLQRPTFPTPSEILGDLADTSYPLWDTQSKQSKSRRRTKIIPPTNPHPYAVPHPPPPSEHSLLVPPSDGISSHEKKRHYLECLEQYVMYLHQQLLLVGIQPIALERSASNSRGMSSKSIRTLLVHMRHMNHQLSLQTNSEEQRFLSLRDAVSKQDH